MPIMITLAGDALPRYRGPMASEAQAPEGVPADPFAASQAKARAREKAAESGEAGAGAEPGQVGGDGRRPAKPGLGTARPLTGPQVTRPETQP